MDLDRPRARRVLARAREIPEGFVRAYSRPRSGRAALRGRGARVLPRPSVPWHRVVRADGSLAKGERQRRLLEAEGVPFRGERVDVAVARIP